MQHLYDTLNIYYPKLTIDWSGALYCGITLEWDYVKRTVDLSMPQYIHSVLHKFQHPPPPKPQHSSYPARPIHYGAKVQYAPEPDTSAALDSAGKHKIQQIVGAALFHVNRPTQPRTPCRKYSIYSITATRIPMPNFGT